MMEGEDGAATLPQVMYYGCFVNNAYQAWNAPGLITSHFMYSAIYANQVNKYQNATAGEFEANDWQMRGWFHFSVSEAPQHRTAMDWISADDLVRLKMKTSFILFFKGYLNRFF